MVFLFYGFRPGNRDNTQKSVNGNLIAGPNQCRGTRYAGHARQTVHLENEMKFILSVY